MKFGTQLRSYSLRGVEIYDGGTKLSDLPGDWVGEAVVLTFAVEGKGRKLVKITRR